MTKDRKFIKTTCPRDCYDGCGILVDQKDGKVVKVKGNSEHPSNRGALCPKCAVGYNGVWLDETARLLHPLKRTGPKGSGEFKPISWDLALKEIAEQLTHTARLYGPDKTFHTHYTGTCSVIAGAFPTRFFDHIGATEVDPDTVCNAAGHAALNYVFGDSVTGFDPRTAKDSTCIVVWGANPSHCGPHVNQNWLYEQSAKVIVIDPVKTETAVAADLHLQLRPGTDAALAYSIAHVIQREGFIDTAYVDNHVKGYTEALPLIEACTPQWGEQATGISAGFIEDAARSYAKGPSLLWLGQGLQRQPHGGNVFRACAMLPALTGNIGKPGAGIYYLNDTLAIAGRAGASPIYCEPQPESRPKAVSQMDMPRLLQDSSAIRSFLVWNCNPLASNPDQTSTRRGLAREDLFTVVIDCFMTDTAEYADIVLPAASFLEFDDLCASYFYLTIAAQVKCQEPLGESLPNQEIFRKLARAMDLDEPTLFEDDHSVLNSTLQAAGIKDTWLDFAERGWAHVGAEPLVLWSQGEFPTPSGKIELASDHAEEDGHPRVPQPHSDPAPVSGKLRLLSPADKWLMNSSFCNDLRIQKQLGPALVIIHPKTANGLNIHDGDQVRVSNEIGELHLTAKLSDVVSPGTLLSYKSRWLKTEPTSANINVLQAPTKTDMGESSSVHGTEVTISRIS